MARIRTIKPEFWMDEDLAELDAETRLLAIGLLNHADDEGYFKANPMIVRATVFPFSDSSLNIHGMLTELSKIGYLELFSGSDGKQYGRITNFLNHQKINRPSASKIKGLCDSQPIHGTFSEPSPPERKGKEQGKERNYTPEDRGLAEFIFERIREVAPKANAPNLDNWSNDIRLMRERDGHSLEEIREVFLFANRDGFWKTNVLSTSKLREKFSTLHSKMITGGPNANSGRSYQSKSDRADEAARAALSQL